LLRNFGKIEDEVAEKDLIVAMESDGVVTQKQDPEMNSISQG
jgi:hypothetical protein